MPIEVVINKLFSFNEKERETLVMHADLVSQADGEHKIILYPETIYQIFKEFEEEGVDSDIPESLAKWCEYVHNSDIDQYIFD